MVSTEIDGVTWWVEHVVHDEIYLTRDPLKAWPFNEEQAKIISGALNRKPQFQPVLRTI